MEEIHVSRGDILVAVLLVVGLVVGIPMIQNWSLRTDQGSMPTTSEEDLAAVAAAVSAMEAVFQIDYQGDKAAWLSRICEVSTPAGCALFSSGADPLWEKYVEAKSVVTAAVQAAEKVGDNGAEQIWQVDILLSSPLPGSNKTADTAYIVLVKTDDGWKFDRFLLEPEIKAILAQPKITVTPAKEGKK